MAKSNCKHGRFTRKTHVYFGHLKMASSRISAEKVATQLQIYADSDSENDLFHEDSDDEYVLPENCIDGDMEDSVTENIVNDMLNDNCDNDADKESSDESTDEGSDTSSPAKKRQRKNAKESCSDGADHMKIKWKKKDQAPQKYQPSARRHS